MQIPKYRKFKVTFKSKSSYNWNQPHIKKKWLKNQFFKLKCYSNIPCLVLKTICRKNYFPIVNQPKQKNHLILYTFKTIAWNYLHKLLPVCGSGSSLKLSLQK